MQQLEACGGRAEQVSVWRLGFGEPSFPATVIHAAHDVLCLGVPLVLEPGDAVQVLRPNAFCLGQVVWRDGASAGIRLFDVAAVGNDRSHPEQPASRAAAAGALCSW